MLAGVGMARGHLGGGLEVVRVDAQRLAILFEGLITLAVFCVQVAKPDVQVGAGAVIGDGALDLGGRLLPIIAFVVLGRCGTVAAPVVRQHFQGLVERLHRTGRVVHEQLQAPQPGPGRQVQRRLCCQGLSLLYGSREVSPRHRYCHQPMPGASLVRVIVDRVLVEKPGVVRPVAPLLEQAHRVEQPGIFRRLPADLLQVSKRLLRLAQHVYRARHAGYRRGVAFAQGDGLVEVVLRLAALALLQSGHPGHQVPVRALSDGRGAGRILRSGLLQGLAKDRPERIRQRTSKNLEQEAHAKVPRYAQRLRNYKSDPFCRVQRSVCYRSGVTAWRAASWAPQDHAVRPGLNVVGRGMYR